MKRIVSLLLLLALCLSLCACGSKTEEEQTQQQVGAVDLSTGEWLGEGGCYRTELLELGRGGAVPLRGYGLLPHRRGRRHLAPG